ncbi:hypothetical protein JXA32_05125 [Candidatus Sumerlaeota bacterium]|nr:hypothetical protein [Candidatus Sumerlaeota bacterium]
MSVAIELYHGETLAADVAPHASHCEFEYGPHGCGPCRIALDEKWRQDRLARAGQRVLIKRDGSTVWRGWLRRMEKHMDAAMAVLIGEGDAERASRAAIAAGEDASLSSVSPESALQTLWTNILSPLGLGDSFSADASGQTLDAFAWSEGDNIGALCDQLAWAAGGMLWGVDPDGLFFLRDPAAFSSEPLATIDLGGGLRKTALITTDDPVNQLTLEIAGGDLHYADSASQADYPRSSVELEALNVTSVNVADLIAAGYFARRALPEDAWTLRTTAPDTLPRPWTGRIAVRDPQREAQGQLTPVETRLRTTLFTGGHSAPVLELLQ